MFHPGETITHTFVIPFDHTKLDKVIVTYNQRERTILERELTSGFDVYVNPKTSNPDPTKTLITITLSQQESLQFEDNTEFFIQLNVLTQGSRHASCIIRGSSGVQQHKGVITDG